MNYARAPWIKYLKTPGHQERLLGAHGALVQPLLMVLAAPDRGVIPLLPDARPHRQLLNRIGGRGHADDRLLAAGLRDLERAGVVATTATTITFKGWDVLQSKRPGVRMYDPFWRLYLQQPRLDGLSVGARGLAVNLMRHVDDDGVLRPHRDGLVTGVAVRAGWWCDFPWLRRFQLAAWVEDLTRAGYLITRLDGGLQVADWAAAQVAPLALDEGDETHAAAWREPGAMHVRSGSEAGANGVRTVSEAGVKRERSGSELCVNGAESLNCRMADPIRSDPIRSDPNPPVTPQGGEAGAELRMQGGDPGPVPEAANGGAQLALLPGGPTPRKPAKATPDPHPAWFQRIAAAYPGRFGNRGNLRSALRAAREQARAYASTEAFADVVVAALQWHAKTQQWQQGKVPWLRKFIAERYYEHTRPDDMRAFLPATTPPWKAAEAVAAVKTKQADDEARRTLRAKEAVRQRAEAEIWTDWVAQTQTDPDLLQRPFRMPAHYEPGRKAWEEIYAARAAELRQQAVPVEMWPAYMRGYLAWVERGQGEEVEVPESWYQRRRPQQPVRVVPGAVVDDSDNPITPVAGVIGAVVQRIMDRAAAAR